MSTKSNVGPATALSRVLGKNSYSSQFPLSTLSGPASLPAALGKPLACLGQQLGRHLLSVPLDVACLGRCHGGHCLGLGDAEKQVRHSSLVSCLASTRRGRVGAVGLGLLFVERNRLCSPEVALWSLCVKGSTFWAQKQEVFCIF